MESFKASRVIRSLLISAMLACLVSPIFAADFSKPFIFRPVLGSVQEATDAAHALGYQTALLVQKINSLQQTENEIPVPVDWMRFSQTLENARNQLTALAESPRSERPQDFSLILSWGEVTALGIAGALTKIYPYVPDVRQNPAILFFVIGCVFDVVLTGVCLYHRYEGGMFLKRVEIPGSFFARLRGPFRQFSNQRRKAEIVKEFKRGYLSAFGSKEIGYSSREIRKMGIQTLLVKTLHPNVCQQILAATGS